MVLALRCAVFFGGVIVRIVLAGIRVIRPLTSGWLTIPRSYRSKGTPNGQYLGVQTIELGFGNIPSMTFQGCVVVHISPTDLYLEYIGMMNSLYPLLKLPIENIEIKRARSMWPDATQVSLPDAASPNFFFENPISDALVQTKLNLSPEFG